MSKQPDGEPTQAIRELQAEVQRLQAKAEALSKIVLDANIKLGGTRRGERLRAAALRVVAERNAAVAEAHRLQKLRPRKHLLPAVVHRCRPQRSLLPPALLQVVRSRSQKLRVPRRRPLLQPRRPPLPRSPLVSGRPWKKCSARFAKGSPPRR